MPNKDELLTIKEVAEHFNISIQAVHKRLEKDNVKPYVVRFDNRVFLKKEILDAELFTYNDEEKIEKRIINVDEEGAPASLNPQKHVRVKIPLKEFEVFKAYLDEHDCCPQRMFRLFVREFNQMPDYQKESRVRKANKPIKLKYWARMNSYAQLREGEWK